MPAIDATRIKPPGSTQIGQLRAASERLKSTQSGHPGRNGQRSRN